MNPVITYRLTGIALERRWQMIELLHVKGWSYKNVARHMSLSDSIVKAQVRHTVQFGAELMRDNPAPHGEFVIYSASENGYWSNGFGWASYLSATKFPHVCYDLPISAEADAVWEKVPLTIELRKTPEFKPARKGD